jgi:molybdopterin/thiamine biosynthesis adenylyltransferase
MANSMQFSKGIHGKWYRMAGKPQTDNATDFLNEIVSAHPQAKKRDWTTHRDRRFEVIGVIVPEENGWRTSGDSVLFIVVEQLRSSGGRKTETAEFIRSFRSDSKLLSDRIPELAELRSKRILVAGVGSIGAPCAIEFARSGIGFLNLADCDVLEAGNSVRWPLGMSYSGIAKVTALQSYIGANHPFTMVAAFTGDVGSEAYTLQIDNQLTEKVDLIFDATAERGISYLLSERARALGVPYVCITSTQGNWGGSVVALRPGKTEPCWNCLCNHLHDGTMHLPTCGPVSSVQVSGCASPTFTGAFVDSSEISLMGTRLAMSLLSTSYPKYGWDYATLALRDSQDNAIAPLWRTSFLQCHPRCNNHS